MLANDDDSDGDTLTIASFTQPAAGTGALVSCEVGVTTSSSSSLSELEQPPAISVVASSPVASHGRER